MKSKKKKNKLSILIVYTKSIAGMQGIELAMLFCHAGFSVKTILVDNAEEHISSELLKEVTEHAPWSNSHKPNWVKADIKYPVCIVIEPSKEFQGMILAENDGIAMAHSEPRKDDSNSLIATAPQCYALQQPPQSRSARQLPQSSIGGASDGITTKIVEYIKEHCKTIKILQKKDLAKQTVVSNVNKQIIAIPDNPLHLRKLFEKLLTETIALTAAKALDREITYHFEGDFSKIDYVKDLEKAFAEGGIQTNNGIATAHAEPRNDDIINGIAMAPHCGAMQPPLPTVFDCQPLQSLASSNPASPPFVGQHLCDSSPNSLRFGGASEFEKDASASTFEGASRVIISNGKKEIEVVLEADESEIKPTKNRIYVSKHKNGLLLIDSIETRLLPDFSCQSCYSRLVSYLKTELTRLDY